MWPLLGLVAMSLVVRPAEAQSAADKATARQLATEGIQLYKSRSYEAALEKLTRAEALYDAPPHLLYIARSQAALGQLVEAAETYRRLVRADLPAGSPAVFTSAVEDGDNELAALEPRVASLRVVVTPVDAANLQITIDGNALNVAALDTNRPTNPGKHVVAIKAHGYLPVTKEFELAEGKTESLQFALTRDENAPATPRAADGTASAEVGQDTGGASPGAAQASAESGKMGFTVALRAGGFGRIGDGGAVSRTATANDSFPGGFGGELDVGFRFMRYFQAKLFGHVYGLAKGDGLEAAAAGTDQGTSVTNSARGQGGGIAVSAGMDPRKLGIFGELGFLVSHDYVLDTELIEGDGTQCSDTTTYKGGGLRLGVGGYIPLSSAISLTPLLSLTMGSTSSVVSEGNVDSSGGAPACIPISRQVTEEGTFNHHEVFLGVGGDFMFGDNWFR
jgi:hypothetical protein